MFGDLMGNMQEKQREMQEKLSSIQVTGSDPESAVTVIANGNKEIVNIEIDNSKLDLSDKEQVEDFVLLAVNDALAKATKEAEVLSQQLVNDMLPGGMGGLGNLFG